jgi:hypothetical protein
MMRRVKKAKIEAMVRNGYSSFHRHPAVGKITEYSAHAGSEDVFYGAAASQKAHSMTLSVIPSTDSFSSLGFIQRENRFIC